MMDAALKTTTNNLEVVHEGSLIKSPPTKLWKARWRQRWFTLRHSGELPGQYFLEYYEDKRCRKLKGRIDLDQCEQVDAGLSLVNRKERYQYMFNVKTPKRIYYLVAESETDMNKWVDAICQVCGLKAYTQDEEPNYQMFSYHSQESPPISPTSIMSGPYIPISECISGPCLYDTSYPSSMTGHAIDNYDIARRLVPSPPRSPTTDAESIITDDESLPSLPNVNWDTFPSADDLKPEFRPCNAGIGSWSVKKRFGRLRIVDSDKPPAADEIPIPPRPPKPSHIVPENPGHNYLNLDGATESSKPTTPSTPAHQTANNELHNSGGVPKNQVKIAKAPITKPPRLQKPQDTFSNTDNHVFRYDFDTKNNNLDNAASIAHSHPSSPSNEENANAVPKITEPGPPLVFRELKPKRKTSDSSISIKLSPTTTRRDSSISIKLSPTTTRRDSSAAVESVQFEPPSINRKLKPLMIKPTVDDQLQLSSPPEKEKIKPIASPTSMSKAKKGRHPSVSDDDNNPFEDKEDIYFYQDNDAFIPASARRLLHLQYLDLDLEKPENGNITTLAQSSQAPLSTTVYKTVDFVKTEAFNRTRQKVERERKQCSNEMT